MRLNVGRMAITERLENANHVCLKGDVGLAGRNFAGAQLLRIVTDDVDNVCFVHGEL